MVTLRYPNFVYFIVAPQYTSNSDKKYHISCNISWKLTQASRLSRQRCTYNFNCSKDKDRRMNRGYKRARSLVTSQLSSTIIWSIVEEIKVQC